MQLNLGSPPNDNLAPTKWINTAKSQWLFKAHFANHLLAAPALSGHANSTVSSIPKKIERMAKQSQLWSTTQGNINKARFAGASPVRKPYKTVTGQNIYSTYSHLVKHLKHLKKLLQYRKPTAQCPPKEKAIPPRRHFLRSFHGSFDGSCGSPPNPCRSRPPGSSSGHRCFFVSLVFFFPLFGGLFNFVFVHIFVNYQWASIWGWLTWMSAQSLQVD